MAAEGAARNRRKTDAAPPRAGLPPVLAYALTAAGAVLILALCYWLGVRAGVLGVGTPLGTPPAATGAAERDHAARYATAVLHDTDEVWAGVLAEGSGYDPPGIALFDGAASSACGAFSGPHYCAAEGTVFLDTVFLAEVIAGGNELGEFAAAYAVARLAAHHVQAQTGDLAQAERIIAGAARGQADVLRLRLALQRDCLAGIWARRARARIGRLRADEVERAMQVVRDVEARFASEADTLPWLASRTRRQTHLDWFMRGYQSASTGTCAALMSGRI